MTPEQALIFLKQMLVLKPGVTLDEMATVIQAWNILAELANPTVKQQV